MKRWCSWPYYSSAFALIMMLDRITKLWALKLNDPYQVTSFLSFDLWLNRGLSWGLFHSSKQTTFTLVSLIPFVILCGALFYAYHQKKMGQCILGEIFVIAGALGNLIDRVWYGGVIDFILLSYKQWSWPYFNVADISIVCGVGIMIITTMYKQQ
jgi:signal peptidase II